MEASNEAVIHSEGNKTGRERGQSDKAVPGDTDERRSMLISSDKLPSFWHFVVPETSNNHHQHNEYYYHHKTLPLPKKEQIVHSKHKISNYDTFETSVASSNPLQPPKPRTTKRRKVKKNAQSARADGGIRSSEKNSRKFGSKGAEWLRVLTPPRGEGTDDDTSSTCEAGDDDDEEEDDELIKRYFSALSSAGSSISWADDAMESEFTSQLSKLWEHVEVVCSGGEKPEEMSNTIYEECLRWRKAFPNANQHHRTARNAVEISPVESPTLDEGVSDDGGLDDDAPFSSLVHSYPYYDKNGQKRLDETVNSLQANFRTLNCATPRPNIEKSTEFVSAWLSECQNSYVPDHRQDPLAILRDPANNSNSRASSPLSMKNHHPNSASVYDNFGDEEDRRNKLRHRLRLVSDVARSSYVHYSRSHAKFVSEPNPENFFTSLALANNEIYGQPDSTSATNNSGLRLRNRITEYDEEGDIDDDEYDRDSPTTEIVSFRPNVRVQRPISSRIRDHTITPLATGYHNSISSFNSRHDTNLNKQTINLPPVSSASQNHRSSSISNAHENHQRLESNGMMDASTISPTQSAVRSGLMKQNYSLYGGGGAGGVRSSTKQHQAPWSRHTGEDHLSIDTNYVTSLYEKYQGRATSNSSHRNGMGGGTTLSPANDRIGLRSDLRPTINNERMRSPTTSTKDRFLHSLDRDRRISSVFDESPGSMSECGGDDPSYKPVPSSWMSMMNRRVSPN